MRDDNAIFIEGKIMVGQEDFSSGCGENWLHQN